MITPTSAGLLTDALAAGGITAAVSGPASAQGDTSNPTQSWHQKGVQWFRVDWQSVPTALQIAAADAVIQATDLTPPTPHQIAVALAALPDATQVVLRAVLLAMLDQINVIRSKLPTPLAAITPAAAKAAVASKINSGDAD